MTNEIINRANSNLNNKLGSEEYNAAQAVVEIISLLKSASASKLPNDYLARQTPEKQYCNLESYRVTYDGYSEMISEVIDFSAKEVEMEAVKTNGIQKAA